MELIDRGFCQKIMDRHTNLRLFTTNFAPVISTSKRISPRMTGLELVYAMPYLVLRREIFNSFKKTKNIFTSVKQIWNIFVHLEFPLNRYEYITTRLDRFSREIVKMQDTRYKMQVKPVSGILYPVSSPSVNLVKSRGFYFKLSSMELAQPVSRETTRIEPEKEPAVTNYQVPVVTTQPTVVIHKPSAVRYEDPATYILTSASDFIAPLFSYYSFPLFFSNQKTVPVKQREALLKLQKSDAVYRSFAHLERETLQNGQRIISYLKSSSMELAHPASLETSRIEPEKESAFANYQLPVVTRQPPIVIHKPPTVRYEDQATYILTSASDFIAPLFSYYSFPLFFSNQKTVPVKQREALLKLQKSDAVYRPYGQKMISYLKSSSMELAQPVSRETAKVENKQTHLNTLEVEKAPIYHTYPEIEHVTSMHTEVIKERVIEKEEESKPPHATQQSAIVDVNRIADQVYSFIERKIRIEKERRGL